MMKKAVFLLTVLLIFTLCLVGCDREDDPPASVNTYTITWVDENGTTLKTDTINEGTVPTYTYEKVDTAEWDYTVNGFATSPNGEVLSVIPAASQDATYYACVSKVKRSYTVEFDTDGGTAIEAASKEYGTEIVAPDEPTKEGFKFVGWCTDEALTKEAVFPLTITGNTKLYAKWNEKIDLSALLNSLLSGYDQNPYSYLPEAMTPSFSAKLIPLGTQNPNYSSFVSIDDIPYAGYGEQWNMVIENIQQSMTFHTALSVIETLSSASITAFNNYLDTNTADTARHTFQQGIYNVTIDFDGTTLFYVLDYTANLPVFGEQTIQIALSTNLDEVDKNVRIQIGDANALAYKITENSYEFAIRYLGIRRAYFTLEREENGNVVGSISEFLGVDGVASTQSAADFYITDDYVTCVGNKADAFIGATGYISEVYSVETGALLGYEVRETLSSIVYNTLWFDLNDINGINSIKYIPANGDVPAKIYLNGSSTPFESKTVGGLSLKTLSRRYDIEFRTQYFYAYNQAEDKYEKIELLVPMLFVQEENFDTLISDVASKNKELSISVAVDSFDINYIQSEYANKIDVFIANKDVYSVEYILEYIGTKIVFE